MDAKERDRLLKDIHLNKEYKGNLIRFIRERCGDE